MLQGPCYEHSRGCIRLSSVPKDPRKLPITAPISFADVLMSGLAVFGLKFPSLLKYDQYRDILDGNLQMLYHINRPPSDTYLRERLDELDPNFIRPAFKKIFAELQRIKCLEGFEFLEGYYLLSLDGTGEFSSSKVCCEQCCKNDCERNAAKRFIGNFKR